MVSASARYLIESAIGVALLAPYVYFIMKDYLPRYRFRRKLDGIRMGLPDGSLGVVSEPALTDVVGRFHRARHPWLTITVESPYGYPRTLRMVTLEPHWHTGGRTITDPLKQCRQGRYYL